MRPKKKKRVLPLIVVAVVVIATIMLIVNIVKNNTSGKYTKKTEDGTRINISKKLHETKTFENFEITEVDISEKNNVSVITATVKNTSQDATEEMSTLSLNFVDKEGNTITTVHISMGTLAPGESTQVYTSATFDYANAYDFTISR